MNRGEMCNTLIDAASGGRLEGHRDARERHEVGNPRSRDVTERMSWRMR
jgi:hypothetical protein